MLINLEGTLAQTTIGVGRVTFPSKRSMTHWAWPSDLRCRARTGRPSVRIMWLGVVSCQVSGAWYFRVKQHFELPVATRHRRDMTEKLLKAMLNPNKQQQQLSASWLCCWMTKMSRLKTKPTKWLCAQRRLRSDWPESSQCALLVAEDPMFLHADTDDSDQTGLTWVFVGRTYHFVGFVMRRLKFLSLMLSMLEAQTVKWYLYLCQLNRTGK